jgi:spore cortex formation protein SpoVR/YcgB (stage V sporulation)
MMEFFHHHSHVIFQPGFDSQNYSGLNPYTLGFNIFTDLKRMSLNPTEEDKKWFPEIAGKGNWAETFRYIVENFKDETFVLQYLSPKVIRDMKLFSIVDEHDVKGMAEALKKLASNPSLTRSYGAAARKHMEEQYDVVKLSAKIKGLLV